MTRERVRQVEEKIFKRLRDVGAINEDGEAARTPRLQVDLKTQPRPDVAKREILVHLRRKDVVRVEEPKEYGQGEAQQDGEKRDEPSLSFAMQDAEKKRKFCYFCGKAGSSVRFYLEKGPYPGTKAVPYGKPSIVPAHSHCVPDP